MTQIIKPTILPVKQLNGEDNDNGLVRNVNIMVGSQNIQSGIISSGFQIIDFRTLDLTTAISISELYPANVLGSVIAVNGVTGIATVTMQMIIDNISASVSDAELQIRLSIYENLGSSVQYIGGTLYQSIYKGIGTASNIAVLQNAQWVASNTTSYFLAIEVKQNNLDIGVTSYQQLDIAGARG